MIDIKDKKDCCGCNACVQKCPRQCISMHMDDEGFYYPEVDSVSCIDCDLCEKVCPVINQELPRIPQKCIAAKGKRNDIVMKSSSAGIFYLLAERTINNGGVVFGARFNDSWDVVNSWTESIDGTTPFMGSKYVQSNIGNSYKQAEQFLKEGREVLFTGTPCQVSGLRHFLCKEYANLICIDVICHGTPSPGVWREYLKYLISPKGRKNTVSSPIYSPLSEGDALVVKGISFRDKRLGWKKYSFVLLSSQSMSRSEENTVSSSYKTTVQQKHYFNLYMKAFLNNLTLRYSCFACPARGGRSGSDVLLGDYWGISRYYPDFYDKNGVSMALAYSEKGLKLLDSLDIEKINLKYDETKGNSNIEYDEKMPTERETFFSDFRKDRMMAVKAYYKKRGKHPLLVYSQTLFRKMLLR